MGFTGISKEKWAGTEAMTGFKLCPVGHALPFEIVDIREGVEKSGENEYVMFCCEYIDDEGENYRNWEYFQLSDERLGFLKGFLEKVGRCDMMADDIEWEEIVGTQFTSDVKHTKKNGETYVNLVLNTVEAISHDIFEIPEDEGEDEGEDLNAKIDEQAALNEEESLSEQTQKALRKAKSTDVDTATKKSKPVSKASPRRPRRAGTDR